ncbi:hypothetical protein FISHEDRAFT_34117, partial [Fistulina hepatica ATCC 64428]
MHALARTSTIPRVVGRIVPRGIVLAVKIEGHACRALVDSGSHSDLISAPLVKQIKMKTTTIEPQINVTMAVVGSRTKCNYFVEPKFEWDSINTTKRFDVLNLATYDVVLGTPFLYQHKITFCLNPPTIIVGSDAPLPIEKTRFTDEFVGATVTECEPTEADVENARRELNEYAQKICRTVEETEFPPFREINHSIPLIDETKILPWRPSRCPEIYRTQWNEKRNVYLKSGRWKMTTSTNTVPMLLIAK